MRSTYNADVISGDQATSKDVIIDLDKYQAQRMSVQNTWTVAASTPFNFLIANVDIIGNKITTVTPYATGRKITLSGATPPAPLVAGDYWAIRVDGGFKLAATKADAIATPPVPIDLSSTGSGTFTPAALAGASVALYESNNGTTWFLNDDFDQSITANGANLWKLAPETKWVKLAFAITDGQVNLTTSVNIKG